MLKSVRIESDGTPEGTRVFDVDTGRDISNIVTDVQLTISTEDIGRAKLTVLSPSYAFKGIAEVELRADLNEMLDKSQRLDAENKRLTAQLERLKGLAPA